MNPTPVVHLAARGLGARRLERAGGDATPRRARRAAPAGGCPARAGCDVVALDGTPLRYDLARGLVHPGFLVSAPGGGREACLRPLTADG